MAGVLGRHPAGGDIGSGHQGICGHSLWEEDSYGWAPPRLRAACSGDDRRPVGCLVRHFSSAWPNGRLEAAYHKADEAIQDIVSLFEAA